MDGLNAPFYPWPYLKGVTIDEAANDLALISSRSVRQAPGASGRRGLVRGTLPWKYGFKSAKALDQDQLRRAAALNFLGIDRAIGVWRLGESEAGRVAPALGSGVGPTTGKRRKGAHTDF